MLAWVLVAGSLSALLIAAGSGCDDEYDMCARSPDDIEGVSIPSARAADDFAGARSILADGADQWLAAQSPPPPPVPPRRPVSLGFIGDGPLQPIAPAGDPPWMHFSCGQCDPDYELP